MTRALPRHGQGSLHIRDIEQRLFSYLFVNKVATSSQIARDIYHNRSHQALYKRLNLLIKSGYLYANYNKELCGRLVYSLTLKSFRDFIRIDPNSFLRGQLQSNSILHDLDLVNIRQRLESLDTVEAYYSENVLRSGINLPEDELLSDLKLHNFDAILKIRKQNQSYLFALEYERTIKFSERYRKYFEKLYSNPTIGGVLYICRDSKVLNHIQQIEESVLAKNWPKFFYSTLPEVIDSNSSLAFYNLRKEKIVLK
ncbi:MAG: hypothetical protein K2Q26_04420 [Bdellovibrionales bacterium]|nr:hypothetical protein [Bdellovibrionales bacterium]